MVAPQLCATKRGPYVWRETEQKVLAARYVAKGLSERRIAKLVGANRRSIARWLQRPQFVALVERFQFEEAIKRGLFRQSAEASAAYERAIAAALAAFDESREEWTEGGVAALRAHRVAAERERSTVALPAIRRPRTRAR